MIRNTLVIFLLMLGFMVQAGDLKPIPDLQAPAASDEKRVSEIRSIGAGWWAKQRGLMAEESFRVAGYFKVARDIPEFASRGDRVWEVRVIHMHTGGPSGVLWIHDKTANVMALGAVDKGKTEPDGAANGSQPIRSETNTTSSAAGSRR